MTYVPKFTVHFAEINIYMQQNPESLRNHTHWLCIDFVMYIVYIMYVHVMLCWLCITIAKNSLTIYSSSDCSFKKQPSKS